tara:strand:+ start:96 stop:860 length:765 start_codon:yes stop_codon:yes gene_type:complete
MIQTNLHRKFPYNTPLYEQERSIRSITRGISNDTVSVGVYEGVLCSIESNDIHRYFYNESNNRLHHHCHFRHGLFLVVSFKNIKLVSMSRENVKCIKEFVGHDGFVSKVCRIGNNASLFATVGFDSTVRLWNIDKEHAIDTVELAKNPWVVHCASRGNEVWTTHSNHITVWDTTNQRLECSKTMSFESDITCMANTLEYMYWCTKGCLHRDDTKGMTLLTCDNEPYRVSMFWLNYVPFFHCINSRSHLDMFFGL